MVGHLLLRGMIVGVVAGCLAFIFSYIFGGPTIEASLIFEQHLLDSHAAGHSPELISRATQSSVGLITSVIIVGATAGGIFGIIYTVSLGRLGRLSPSNAAIVIALICYITIVLIPQLKFPANPPSIGNEETLSYRTKLYFLMLGLSIIFSIICVILSKYFIQFFGSWIGINIAILLYVFTMILIMLLLPAIDEVPDGFPANILWQFRMSSLGLGAVLWGTIGIGYGSLARWRPLNIEQC